MAALVRRLHRTSHASRYLRTSTSGASLPTQENLPYFSGRDKDDEETASASSRSLRASESTSMSSVNWGNYAIGRGFGSQSRGRYGSGFVQHWSVRYASTEAAATGLHFVEAETGDTVQADVAGGMDQVVSDQVMSAGTSSLGEVAAATADCSAPTAALQHLIDYVHTQGGLPWWLSIAATTVAIRLTVLPVLIWQMKATARLTVMRPELERITNAIKESGYDPKVTEANQKRMKELFAQHKTNPFMPLMGAFVQAPLFISFFFAIRNMAEKVPSFKEGGALWFTDLTTADPYYILPVMSGLFTLATIELGAMDGMQGQPMIGKMKMFFRGFAVLIVPLTATFPKALFCYWLTTNMCSLIQTTVLRQPAVKRAVGIPETAHLAAPVTPAALANAVTLNSPPKRSGKKSKR
ncbi:hypothetical protein M758_1G119400 [Ceratodon purpureus]|nr:hypothetical protein M758_1G119400 [Ceratodon purpureus]